MWLYKHPVQPIMKLPQYKINDKVHCTVPFRCSLKVMNNS